MPQSIRAAAAARAPAPGVIGRALLGATETQKRVGTLIEHGDVAGFEGVCLIEACERLVVALERMRTHPDRPERRPRADLILTAAERGDAFADAAELRLDGAEHIERIEMIRRRDEHHV